jgi:hypothetical protein
VADTAATREMEQRLAAMRRDRDEIDKMIAPSPSSSEGKQTTTCQLSYGVACAERSSNTDRYGVACAERSSNTDRYQLSYGVELATKEEPIAEKDKKWITFRSSN